ncbi:phage major capsid protein [Helicobacter mastomyrinus]|uniref:Phage major capsid protein n=1 Tax=Helicobacter mastomyrinus TaxID=287948 RepID=A0ABZ3F4Y1_9HELI|nr:phage major capsid protein [uncultured Helicobacter sp.]
MFKDIKPLSLQFEDSIIKENDWTISFTALSHNALIKRSGFFGDFYISINTDSIDFNAKTFYLDHSVSFENAIGKIIEFKRDTEGNLKVKVQFYPDIEESHNAFLKYQKGLSNSVSVGFGECEIVEKEKIDNLPHYHIQSGEIIELSAVWQGADPNAVISEFCLSKQNQTKEATMPQYNERALSNTDSKESQSYLTQGVKMNEELKTQVEQLSARQDEVKQIIELGKIANASDKALKAIETQMSYKEFSQSLIANNTFSENKITQSPRDNVHFSLANYALSVAKGERVGEIEFKQGTNGLEIPNDYYSRFESEQNKSIDSTSAGFIPEYYRSDKFIEQVFAESNILSLCDKLTGLVGTQRIPRDNSNIKAYWVNEGEKTTTSKLGADFITLSPHTLKAKVLITRQMLGMTPFALEAYIIREIKRAIKLRLEEDLLYGEKSDDCPINGIFNTTGVQSIAGYFSDTNYKKTLEFGGKLTGINLSIANTHFATNSKGMIHLQSTHYDESSEKYLLNERATYVAGYQYFMNNLIKDNHAIFGDYSNVLVGTWGGLQVQALKDDEGDLIFTGFYDVGMELKRANAFVIAKS